MFKKIALFLIALETFWRICGALVHFFGENYQSLPIYTYVLNIILIICGIIILFWNHIKGIPFSPILVFYLLDTAFLIVNFASLFHISEPLTVFESMVTGSFLDFLINIVIIVLIIRQMSLLKLTNGVEKKSVG